jgi:pimeloyl-ACP methyl ester carboxylesterase
MHLICRGSGSPVLFIHGIPTSNLLWSGVIEQMCGRFTCFAVDLPGLGRTPSEPHDTDYLARVSERIEAIRIKNNIAQWHVVGHDGGSAVAAQYAHSFPRSVSCLALLSPALFPDLKPYYLLELLRVPIMGECLAPFIHRLFWNVVMQRAGRNEEGAQSTLPPFREPFSGFWGAWRFMQALRWGRPCDVLAHLPGILPQLGAPTLILHGARDPAILRSFARRARNLIPNSELVYVDCGHFIPLNRPSFVANQLAEFFGRSYAEAGASHDHYPIQSCI